MTFDAFIEKLADQQAQIDALRIIVAQQDSTITGMKHYLKVAADYRNEDPEQVLAAIQAALGKASTYSKTRKVFKRKRRKD